MKYISRIYLVKVRILNNIGEDIEYKFFSDTNNIDKIEKHIENETGYNCILDICIKYEGNYQHSVKSNKKIKDLSIYKNFNKNLEYAKNHYLKDCS